MNEIRGARPSLQASRLRSLMLQAARDENQIVPMACSYDALSSKLTQAAGFPVVFLSGFVVAASLGLPDTGYVAFGEMTQKLSEVMRQVDVPILVDGDTGYGGPMNVKRTVQGFALAGAAGVMIEDQTWPKRCGHSQGKTVVPEVEAYARIQAAVDARNEGLDIWILGRTDSLILGYDEAVKRARRFIEIGVDAIFVEAVPDRSMMRQLVQDLQFPCMANIIPGGCTEVVSTKDLAAMGYACVVYPFALVAAEIKAVRQALQDLKVSFESGNPPDTLEAKEVFEAVGFPQYYAEEGRYQYNSMPNGPKATR
ncbi:uncharacterized protein Z520_08221 [Fonsecaea multimorphosa CBS 102226]|uniref:Carboxyvinyl-carboxyphosphonate phosphorylmutase n=1 Tax=Fonsecaea multimorphosa CBS 102226 TaxID=1442371 RepID=A0A0D2IFY1_9EURO|nr:uncharacterized protein Z520_08221 [Fonsecaea multimorphosa CBS 102226]KIX95966.1 hypothetical protein Z520_08221 [Fonsecaea multimorphosa CBS 102226]OAL21737.1 hypothetical protein AYO22_07679 [Fonsecaea multimorphosa]